jgi:hypothetical protein
MPLVILAGLAYFIVGFGFAQLDDLAASERGLFLWRLGAWVASALVYAAHIGHEHFRLRNSTFSTALHAAIAVGIGAFLLAVAATLYALTLRPSVPLVRYLIALVVWPIITAVPAFVVAIGAAWVLGHLPAKRLAQ